MQLLLDECPQLDAVWFEVLRIYNNAAVACKATVDTAISNKSISKNETVLGPFRQFHLNSDIFGQDVTGFDPNRFLANKNLSHVRGYYPFGGGNTYCPGRFFARSEIYTFVATALPVWYGSHARSDFAQGRSQSAVIARYAGYERLLGEH